jgi:hypothetical protein
VAAVISGNGGGSSLTEPVSTSIRAKYRGKIAKGAEKAPSPYPRPEFMPVFWKIECKNKQGSKSPKQGAISKKQAQNRAGALG